MCLILHGAVVTLHAHKCVQRSGAAVQEIVAPRAPPGLRKTLPVVDFHCHLVVWRQPTRSF
jgi:hypothetical protein